MSRVGDKVVLEPLETPPFDVDAWLARLEAYRDVPFPDLPEDPPVADDPELHLD